MLKKSIIFQSRQNDSISLNFSQVGSRYRIEIVFNNVDHNTTAQYYPIQYNYDCMKIIIKTIILH